VQLVESHYNVVRGKRHVEDEVQMGSIEEVGDFELSNVRGTGQEKSTSHRFGRSFGLDEQGVNFIFREEGG